MDQQKVSQKKWKRVMMILLILLVLAFFLSILLGSVRVPPLSIIKILVGSPVEKESWQYIIINFRVPKAATAILVGSGLAVSGLQMQTLFRNPLAGPFVLGISSGASLGVALAILSSVALFGSYTGSLGSWYIVLSATAGASLVLFLVVLVSSRVRDSMSLLIIGLMFGSATGSVVSVLQYFSDAKDIQAFLIWTFGSLGGMTLNELEIFVPLVILGLLIALLLAKPLDALLLGENYARSMGLSLKKTRFWIIVSTSLLAGVITAFTGPIAFIGIAVPHLSRLLFNTSNHRLLMPLTALTGALMMLICDIIAQVPGSEQTLPINAITSLFGAPVVIWLIVKRKNFNSRI
jgi:iron complex transport system permease protein